MQAFSKMLVLLLLAAVFTAPLAAQELRNDVSSQDRPAGCHGNNRNAPAPGPASHICCAGTHQPAILQQTPTFRPSLQASAWADFAVHSFAVMVSGTFPNPVIVSGDPPKLSPLRV
jgi:hypothetical protein